MSEDASKSESILRELGKDRPTVVPGEFISSTDSENHLHLTKGERSTSEISPTLVTSTAATVESFKNEDQKEDPGQSSTIISDSPLNTQQANTLTGTCKHRSDIRVPVSDSDRGNNSDILTATVKNTLNENESVPDTDRGHNSDRRGHNSDIPTATVTKTLHENLSNVGPFLPSTDENTRRIKKSETDLIETNFESNEVNLNKSDPCLLTQLENKDLSDFHVSELSNITESEVNPKRSYPSDESSDNLSSTTDVEQPTKQRKLCGSLEMSVPKIQNISETKNSEPLGEDVHVVHEEHEDISHLELLDSDSMEGNWLISRTYDFSKTPVEITRCQSEFGGQDNCLKGCKWSPDGSCLLTCSNDCSLRLFNLPPPLLQGQTDNLEDMCSVLRMKEGETIYDYAWYPMMSSNEPATCCLVSTSSNTPVHMWDAFTGEIRCSYRAFDQVDEVTPAYCVAFNKDGSKLFTGFNKMIRVFDVTRPGRDCQNRPTYVKEGQSGIISCIVPSPTQPSLYAAGSYSRSVALYNDSVGDMVCMFEGHQGGVTHLQFTPDGTKLLSGGRKDPEILCWDLRYPGQILFTVQRDVLTNQRIYFDIDWSGRYLASGNHDGSVRIWDMSQPLTESSSPSVFQPLTESSSPSVSQPLTESSSPSDPLLKPTLSFQAHSDTVNGVSFHPSMPLLATSSGQRHFRDLSAESDEETEELSKVENSIKLWCAT